MSKGETTLVRRNKRAERLVSGFKVSFLVHKMNPLGKDGRALTCKACGSFRHMLPECPDSWENMQKLNIRDEDMVLETKYN